MSTGPDRRWLSAWRTLSTYQAEQQLLPVGGRDINRLIQQFFSTYACLRAEFQEGGMPVTAIRVLRLHCPALNATLERIHCLECAVAAQDVYQTLDHYLIVRLGCSEGILPSCIAAILAALVITVSRGLRDTFTTSSVKGTTPASWLRRRNAAVNRPDIEPPMMMARRWCEDERGTGIRLC
jgi:hypothetical protein